MASTGDDDDEDSIDDEVWIRNEIRRDVSLTGSDIHGYLFAMYPTIDWPQHPGHRRIWGRSRELGSGYLCELGLVGAALPRRRRPKSGD
jgi:hypothetical protein